LVSNLAISGAFGTALANPATGYSVVYHIEIYLMFATLIALGPLVGARKKSNSASNSKLGLAELPG
jgi:BCD family chlorophyll transporter-like MFS transporter